MLSIKIPKGNGTFRVVYCPNHRQKKALRALIPRLAAAERELALFHDTSEVAHGFIRGRSPVTAAQAHAGDWSCTLCTDLKSWFDSVSSAQIANALAEVNVPEGEIRAVLAKVTIGGAPRQGLPTSPIVANLAAVKLDYAIKRGLEAILGEYVYTRYADDLTVSMKHDDTSTIQCVLRILQMAAGQMNWAIAEQKTSIYRSTAGKRIVLGLAVDQSVQPTRATKRRLRAARYQGENRPETTGLAEWAKCKSPHDGATPQSLLDYYRDQITESGVVFDPEGGYDGTSVPTAESPGDRTGQEGTDP